MTEKFPKPNNNNEDERIEKEVREKVYKIVEDNFIPKHEPLTQEEIQANWDKRKSENSKKFDPNNLEQGDLF
jgi:hypothetical protein